MSHPTSSAGFDYKRMFELKCDDWMECCKEIDTLQERLAQLKDVQSNLRTNHEAVKKLLGLVVGYCEHLDEPGEVLCMCSTQMSIWANEALAKLEAIPEEE